MNKLTLFAYFVLALLFVGCDTADDNAVETDYVTYNQQIINYLQNKYGVAAKIEFSPNFKQRLNKTNIEDLEKYYSSISSIKNGVKCEMVQNVEVPQTRDMSAGTQYFTQFVNYNLDPILVFVCYNVDSRGKIADNPEIVSGLAGNGVSNNNPRAKYKVDNYKSDCYVSAETIYADCLRGDYTAFLYYSDVIDRGNGYNPDKIINGIYNGNLSSINYTGFYAKVTCKLAAYGTVDASSNTGSFTLHYSGEGSWYFDTLPNIR